MSGPAGDRAHELSARSALRAHLVRHRIAGQVATPRANSLRNYQQVAAGDRHYSFGLRFSRSWRADEVLAVMAERVGVDADPARSEGPDHIDPERTLERLDAMAGRLADLVAAGGRVLLATGHPGGLLPVYLAVGRALTAAGCRLLTPASGAQVMVDGPDRPARSHQIRYVCGVAVVSAGGGLTHTHSPEPMRSMLAEVAGPMPDLVVADHGFAGAAATAGCPVVGFADCNDPALFLAEAEGSVAVSVPLDDNVLPELYEPVTRYLLSRSGEWGTIRLASG